MKATLLLATLSVALASPSAFAAKDNAKPAPAAEKPKAPSATGYTVKAGDSFAKIARSLGTTADNLAKANGLTTDSVIRPGQTLKIPAKPVAKVAAPAKPQAAPAVKSTDKTHQVQAGETFSSIAKKHGISSAALAAANPTTAPTSLRPGQILNLASSPAAKPNKAEPDATAKVAPPVKAAAPAEPPPAPHAVAKSPTTPVAAPRETKPVAEASKPTAPETSAAAAAPAPAGLKYFTATVDSETTLGEFAAKHGADAKRLNELNGLDLTPETVLAKGSELIVPVQP